MTPPGAPFTCGHASSPNWRDAAAQCLQQAGKGPPGANLGFLYITDNFAGEAADMVAYFRRNTGILHWSGTVGVGVFGTGREYYDEPAVAIMLCNFEEGSFRVFSGVRSPPDLERQSLHLGGLPANFAIIHGDPRNAQLPRLVGDLAGCMESGFVAGGLTSSRREVVQIMFCRRDEPSAAEDMSRMLDSIKSGLFGRPRGGLYYSCVGRGPNLFSEESGEANMIREALGEFPLVGFFCNGEISHNRLYGYTGVLTLFL